MPERRSFERRQNPPPLEDRETRLRLATKAAGLGTYDLDCRSGQNRWSPELKVIAGLPSDDSPISLQQMEALLHPEDRERIRERVLVSLDPQGRGELKEVCRIVRPDGQLRWIKIAGQTFFAGRNGERYPLGAAGIIIDITEPKEAEEALRRSQQNLDLAVRAAAIGIWNWDLRTGQIEWSERCRILFGLPPGGPITLDQALAALHPDDRGHTRASLQRALAEHGDYTSQHRIVWSDGSIHWVQSLGQGRYDEHGKAFAMNGIVMDINERKAVEEALREQQEQLRLALRAGRSGTFEWDARTYEHHWSDEMLALYGLRREEFTGRWEEWFDCMLPEDREVAREAVDRSLKLGQYSVDFRIRRRDTGEVRWMSGRGQVYFDSNHVPVRMLGVNIDVTEQKRAEEVLRRQAMLLDLAHEPILFWTPEQGILFWNDGCQNLYGYSREEAYGKSGHQLLKTAYPVPMEEFLDKLKRDGNWLGEVRQTTRDGRELVVITRLQRLPMDGSFVILEANRDITDRKRMEEALMQVNEDLERRIETRTTELIQANKALERSNDELQQFAYIAAHDLQTPLRSIASFAQLVQKSYQGQLDAQADNWIQQVVDNARRMHMLIQELLAYSRVGSRGSPFAPIDLNQLFDQMIRAMDTTIRAADAQVTREDLPVVTGDGTQLSQVLQNLIDNGIKYRGEAPPRLHVAARRQGEEWLVSVSDNGIGIADKHRERIFEIFRRLHTQQAYPGTGIGLSICRRVIQRHGGRIWVESEPGKGSTFYFTLPVSPTEPPGSSAA